MRAHTRSWWLADSLARPTGPMVAERTAAFRPTGVPVVDAYLADRAASGELTRWSVVPHDLAVLCDVVGREMPGRAVEESLAAFRGPDVGWYIEQLLRPRRGRRLAVATVYRRLAAAGRFFAWAVASGALPCNPFPPERAVGWVIDGRDVHAERRAEAHRALSRRARSPPG